MAQERTIDFSFRLGASPIGELDTLYAANLGGVFRFDPGATNWVRVCEMSICRATFIAVNQDGYLIIGMTAGPSAGGVRSTDGGKTWENNVIGYGVATLLQSTLPALEGAVYAGNANSVSWSTDGGAAGTWILGDPMGGEPIVLAEVPPSTTLPDGRLAGGVWNGAVYSDDGGETWTESDLFVSGSIAVNSLSFASDDSHPFGGVLYAGVTNTQISYPALYRSNNGGENWDLVHPFEPGQFSIPAPDRIEVASAPNGLLFVGIEDTQGGTTPSVGTVVASIDGGNSWTNIADSSNGWDGYGTLVMRLGRDGRIYVGTDHGVWSTVDPIVVAVDEGPEVQPPGIGMSLDIAPSPTREYASVTLTLEQPASIKLSVYDTLGRKVAVLADDYLSAGGHTLPLYASGFASGVYFVCAVASSVHGTSTQFKSLTVVN